MHNLHLLKLVQQLVKELQRLLLLQDMADKKQFPLVTINDAVQGARELQAIENRLKVGNG